MPTLFRAFMILAIVAAGLGIAIVLLATFVEPVPREMSVTIPPERLNPPTAK